MTAEFAAAFLAAQKEFPTIAKTKTADMGNYKYKFADLGDVLDAALPILHKHGLVLSQPLVSSDGRVGVGTRLYHESGHVERFGELLLSAGGTPQAAGSALTYARRYAACAALGIVADEDDDGRVAARQEPSTNVKEWTEQRLQVRLKKQAADLADGDVDLARDFYEKYAPEKWSLENVEVSEKAMRAGVAG